MAEALKNQFGADVPQAIARMVLAVHPSFPAKTLKELIVLAKQQPGKYTFASSGTGGSPHLAGELLRMGGVMLNHTLLSRKLGYLTILPRMA